jgi:hypothetical protein
MSTGPGLPIPSAVRWAQEWQRLNWIAIHGAIGHYLHGCANAAMTRTPLEALAMLHETQAVLIGHSADALAQACELWRRQNRERARALQQPGAKP